MTVGQEEARRYWEIFEIIPTEIGYADYLGTVQRYRLYPGSLDAVEHVRQWGVPVVLSDGDVVFQPRKLYKSGLYKQFDGNALIYVHKEHELEDIEARFPADHYVMMDDKIRLPTVFVRQGHYAMDLKAVAQYPPADVTIDHIGDLVNCSWPFTT